jgi:hypothetical protein
MSIELEKIIAKLLLSIGLSILCYLIIDILIVKIDIFRYLIIEFLLVLAHTFYKFVDRWIDNQQR